MYLYETDLTKNKTL